jgi:hypothetical protein
LPTYGTALPRCRLVHACKVALQSSRDQANSNDTYPIQPTVGDEEQQEVSLMQYNNREQSKPTQNNQTMILLLIIASPMTSQTITPVKQICLTQTILSNLTYSKQLPT